jgi:hypothetical protein
MNEPLKCPKCSCYADDCRCYMSMIRRLETERDALKAKVARLNDDKALMTGQLQGARKAYREARDEVAFQKSNVGFLDKQVTMRRKENDQLSEAVGWLREALGRWGNHQENCAIRTHCLSGCDCGWYIARRSLLPVDTQSSANSSKSDVARFPLREGDLP